MKAGALSVAAGIASDPKEAFETLFATRSDPRSTEEIYAKALEL